MASLRPARAQRLTAGAGGPASGGHLGGLAGGFLIGDVGRHGPADGGE